MEENSEIFHVQKFPALAMAYQLEAPVNICSSCTDMQLKGLISGRGHDLLQFNQIMQLFTNMCKQIASTVRGG